jgi:O-antigen/teichoic acid export membrane protein
MPAEIVEPPPQSAAAHRASFFRQSGWLMIATVGGGVFMTAVHLLSHAMPKGEYGQFVAFLSVAMFIPAMPLQMVLAQQTARALALHREHELSGLIRAAWLGTFLVWLLAVAVVLLCQRTITAQWNITNPAAIWLMLPVVLFTVWLPMFYGVLQGQQNFLSMGWSMMLHGMGRVAICAIAVFVVHYYAAGKVHYYAPGMVLGVLGGLTLALVIAIWPTRSLWLPSPQTFEWRRVLGQIIPLTLGFAAYQFLLTADTMLVRGCFSGDDSAYYGSAGTLARASMWLVGPLAAVMFPKIVHAKAKGEKSDLMGVVLVGTLILAACGAAGLWVLGPWVVYFMNGKDYMQPVSLLLHWYVWAVVPLAVANVLLNNLLARSLFKVVPALCVLAVGYGLALTHFHATPKMVIQTLCVGNLLLLAVCAYYTWGVRHPKTAG